MTAHSNIPPSQWHGARFTTGLYSAIGTPDVAGQLYYATDTGRVYVANPDLTWRVLEARHNFSATAAPTASDDSSDGYSVGSLWFNTTAQTVHACLDATAANAVWIPLGGSVGGTLGGARIRKTSADQTITGTGNVVLNFGTRDYDDDSANGHTPNLNYLTIINTGRYWVHGVIAVHYASTTRVFVLNVVSDPAGTPTTLDARRYAWVDEGASQPISYEINSILNLTAGTTIGLQVTNSTDTITIKQDATDRACYLQIERLS